MKKYIKAGNLAINEKLYKFVGERLLPASNLSQEEIWNGFGSIVADLAPLNAELIAKRQHLQNEIDKWHNSRKSKKPDFHEHRAFLEKIGYLVPEGPDFQITTEGVDPEIAEIAGPQLVVPLSNPRFALNAANARWGSLFDSLYGSDVIPESAGLEQGTAYNINRGNKVIAHAMSFLDSAVPLEKHSHSEVTKYFLAKSPDDDTWQLMTACGTDKTDRLRNPLQFKGYLGTEDGAATILLANNGLHIELQIDHKHIVGRQTNSGLKDVLLEAALTVIQDLEDSVAAVDVDDKLNAYGNWAGLMDGTLEETFLKNGKPVRRTLNQDRIYITPNNESLTLDGRSLMLVRNVGLLTTTDCVLDSKQQEIPEGFLDAFITTLCALPDLLRNGGLRNSQHGSIYIVKPKLHGPEEVQLTNTLFSRIEDLLHLAPNTIKIGVMDEERRTSANLKECIRAVKERVVFINTGFLDRTGDEIHTNMYAGAFLPKEEIKSQPWLACYEKRNVAIGLACGFKGKAQIGKGMWPKPDEMADMLATKSAHLQAGASCAWVPSPTAAVLHAMHYHKTNVGAVQENLLQETTPGLEDLFTIPLLDRKLSPEEISKELENNLQGILGYVVRWIDQGIGCSKIPDIHDIGLMEDRATLRISSQHIANWLHHGICSREQVETTFREMVQVVDRQNAKDPAYRQMAPDFAESQAFQAAQRLVFEGEIQPNGYTEPVLHRARQQRKKCR